MPETPSSVVHPPQPANTTHLLENLNVEDREVARARLINYSYGRLRRLARRMLRNYPLVRQQVESGDVLHEALMRLQKALTNVTPESSKHFWNLAAMKIRQELLTLAREIVKRPKPVTPGNSSDAEDELAKQPDSTGEPASLERWADFHELIDALPEKEREVFYLVWYDWLTQEQAAEVLGVSVRTVRRLWLSARLKMSARMCGERPS